MPKTKPKTNLKGKIVNVPKVKIVNVEKKRSLMDPLVPTRTCYVCGRESRDLLMVGPHKFRHSDCHPGSPNWIDYIDNMRVAARTEEQTLLHTFYTKEKA